MSVNSRTSYLWILAYLHTFYFPTGILSYLHTCILAYWHTGILAHRHTFNSSISRGAFTPNNYKTCNRGEGFLFLPRKSRQERLMVLNSIICYYLPLSSKICYGGEGLKSLLFWWNFPPFGTIRYHSVPFRTIRYHSVPFGTILYHSAPFRTIRYHTVPFGNIRYHSIPFSTIR